MNDATMRRSFATRRPGQYTTQRSGVATIHDDATPATPRHMTRPHDEPTTRREDVKTRRCDDATILWYDDTMLGAFLRRCNLAQFFWIFWKMYHAIILAKLHVYHHSYQDFYVPWFHMALHDTFFVESVCSVTWQVRAIPNAIEIPCGRIPPTTSGIRKWLPTKTRQLSAGAKNSANMFSMMSNTLKSKRIATALMTRIWRTFSSFIM